MTKGTAVAARPITDGKRIKWTLEQLVQETQQRVRLDWCRFTLPLDAVVRCDRDLDPDLSVFDLLDRPARETLIACRNADAALDYSGAMAVARSGATQFSALVGVFTVGQVEDKGMDYYAARCPLMFEGAVVGYCLAGGKSEGQAATVHLNLWGSACLHLSPAKWAKVREWVANSNGWLTRVDLAVDVWTGEDITALPDLYRTGAFDVRGQRPSQTENGSWTSGHSRTFNVGKRETGKALRVYEKGDELFGHEANDDWIRYEVEMRNNARVLDLDLLTRPADFFAGAYPFCTELLERLHVDADPQRIPAGQKLVDATAESAVLRGATWFSRICGPYLCWLLSNGGEILDFIAESEAHRVPSRFRGFTLASLRAAAQKVAAGFAPPDAPSFNGA